MILKSIHFLLEIRVSDLRVVYAVPKQLLRIAEERPAPLPDLTGEDGSSIGHLAAACGQDSKTGACLAGFICVFLKL